MRRGVLLNAVCLWAIATSAAAQSGSCTTASASHFADFGVSVDRTSVACDVTVTQSDQLSFNAWLRLAPNEGWSELDALATELDLTATYVPFQNDMFAVSATGGGYFFPADDFDATTGTVQVALDVTPPFSDVLAFHFEYGEYFGGFRETQWLASAALTLPLSDEWALDITGGHAWLEEAGDQIVFGEVGLSRSNWRVWVEAFDGTYDQGARLALTWSWEQ